MTPMSPLRVVSDGVSGTHSDPVWNWTILLQLLSELSLDTECLEGRLKGNINK